MDPSSDTLLLRAWRAGDPEAGARLLQRHFVAVFRFFRSKVAAHAEDLTQKTFLACVESRDTIDPQRPFRPYLFGVARHRLLAFLRDHRPSRTFDPDSDSLAQHEQVDPESDAAFKEERRLLMVAIRSVPLDHQVALELFYWEGLSTEEIAVVLDAAPGTVRSRLSRARALLRYAIVASSSCPELSRSTLRAFSDWVQSLRARSLAPCPSGIDV